MARTRFTRLGFLMMCGVVACAHMSPYESADSVKADGFKGVSLPFKPGTRFYISQGAFGKNSHSEKGGEYRWDFDVPLGTDVASVEDGVVLSVWEPANGSGGCDAKFSNDVHNVKVLHKDGTIAQYSHVTSRVKPGQKVREGSVIALTSLNGFICQPQLCFSVYRSKDTLYGSQNPETIPLRFLGVPGGIMKEGYRGTVPMEAVLRDMKLAVTQVPGFRLPAEALPSGGLKIVDRDVDPVRYQEFQERLGSPLLIEDELLVALASMFQGASVVRVVTTSGIPSPYDAWTAQFEGAGTIFFNLDLWTTERLDRAGSAVLRHEIAHILLEPVLSVPAKDDFVGRLNHVLVNEGVAHFIGYAGDRTKLLTDRKKECEQAAAVWKDSIERLSNPSVSVAEKERILRDADTGSYWKKFGAITGMCRLAQLIEKEGVAGLGRFVNGIGTE